MRASSSARPGASSVSSAVRSAFGERDRGLVAPLAVEPGAEAGHRRERHEGRELGEFAGDLLDHLLDQEIAEGDAAEALLAVRYGIEHRGLGVGRVQRLALLDEDRGDGVGNVAGQRHLDEDQRLVDEGRVEEGVATPVRTVDAGAQVVPVADFVHRLVADDLLEDIGRGRPVDPAQHEEPPIEPGREQMGEVAVEAAEVRPPRQHVEQAGAHGDQCRGGAGREVQPADQLLPARLAGGVEFGEAALGGGGGIGGDRLVEPRLVRAEGLGQRLEEGDALAGLQGAVEDQYLAGQRDAGGLAAAGEQLLAEFDDIGGADRPDGAAFAPFQQGAAALGYGAEQVAEEAGVAIRHASSNPQSLAPDLRSVPMGRRKSRS